MIIQFEHVGLELTGKIILKDVTFEVAEGEFISIVGASGSGKTSLLRMIYFDLLPTVGAVRVGLFSSESIRKREVPQIRKQLGVAFQDSKMLDDRTIFENIAFVMEVTNCKKDVIQERVHEVLQEVGLENMAQKFPRQLSGGEQQRAALARALANKPEVLLADEPTGNLDQRSGIELLELLKTINKNETSVILVSHNREIVKQTGGRILELEDGRIV